MKILDWNRIAKISDPLSTNPPLWSVVQGLNALCLYSLHVFHNERYLIRVITSSLQNVTRVAENRYWSRVIHSINAITDV